MMILSSDLNLGSPGKHCPSPCFGFQPKTVNNTLKNRTWGFQSAHVARGLKAEWITICTMLEWRLIRNNCSQGDGWSPRR